MKLIKPLGYYTDDSSLRFHVLDVGEGLMILIIFPNDQVMLFDCNITGDNESTILKYLSDNIPFKMNPATGNRTQLIAEEYDTVLQLAAVFVRNREQLM